MILNNESFFDKVFTNHTVTQLYVLRPGGGVCPKIILWDRSSRGSGDRNSTRGTGHTDCPSSSNFSRNFDSTKGYPGEDILPN